VDQVEQNLLSKVMADKGSFANDDDDHCDDLT
jgi:hypothetical protein